MRALKWSNEKQMKLQPASKNILPGKIVQFILR